MGGGGGGGAGGGEGGRRTDDKGGRAAAGGFGMRGGVGCARRCFGVVNFDMVLMSVLPIWLTDFVI